MSTTTTEDLPQGVAPADQVRLGEQVRVAVLFDGVQTDVVLPATASVAAVVDSLVRVLQEREDDDDGMRQPDQKGMLSPGLVTLMLINGRPLDRTQTLAQQGVVDGDLLLMQICDAEIEFTPIIESPASAVAVLNKARESVVTERTAKVVAGAVAAISVAVVTALLALAWWRNLEDGQDWNLTPALSAAGLGLVLLLGGSLVWWRQRQRVTATALWLPGALIAFPAAAVMASPGHPGAWHLMFSAAVATVLAAVLWKLAPVPRGLAAAVTIVGAGVAVLALIHAWLGVTLQNLSVAVLVVSLFVMTGAPKLAARMAGIPVPPFPTVTGKDTFEDADAIANEALVAAEHQGTPSIERLRRGAEASAVYLTALLASVSVFFVGSTIWALNPGQGRWWLATVYLGILSTILILRGRAFAARSQAIIVVSTGLAMVVIVAVKYALAGSGTTIVYSAAAAVLGLGLAAMMAVAIVPARVFSPGFRKVIEWVEYLLIVVVPPLAIWLLNLIYLARHS
ncbi:MAG: type VII secretion integral membrane protein EccD [Actinomycetia bacterium]|nr:type VII secretion integral membrane protein EccD [Actinomycetes bacterium]